MPSARTLPTSELAEIASSLLLRSPFTTGPISSIITPRNFVSALSGNWAPFSLPGPFSMGSILPVNINLLNASTSKLCRTGARCASLSTTGSIFPVPNRILEMSNDCRLFGMVSAGFRNGFRAPGLDLTEGVLGIGRGGSGAITDKSSSSSSLSFTTTSSSSSEGSEACSNGSLSGPTTATGGGGGGGGGAGRGSMTGDTRRLALRAGGGGGGGSDRRFATRGETSGGMRGGLVGGVRVDVDNDSAMMEGGVDLVVAVACAGLNSIVVAQVSKSELKNLNLQRTPFFALNKASPYAPTEPYVQLGLQ